jgi:hypothetical protein
VGGVATGVLAYNSWLDMQANGGATAAGVTLATGTQPFTPNPLI